MKNKKKKPNQLLRKLGVYGFDHLEPVIIASLVSEDPLLLIGKAGTGKTYLLNTISEALRLNHRHYNASYISFDDLIGFPYPDNEEKSVSFLKTPATIWDAESVLVDELSRCKPETQNKFFSIIHEKKIQGIPLEKLKYRWAAMNPLMNGNSDDDEIYEGSLSLDQALADRFAFILEVPDWNELSKEEQELVIYPAGEGAVTGFSQELIGLIETLRPVFLQRIGNPDGETVMYCRLISTILGNAGLRISPRRARLLARNFIALFLVAEAYGIVKDEKDKSKLYRLGLKWSLPQRAWKGTVPDHQVDAAHKECMRLISECDPKERWMSEFLLVNSLTTKIEMLSNPAIGKEIKSLAVLQFLHRDSEIRTGVFAFAVQPYAESYGLVDEEALNELTNIAVRIMKVEGMLEWRENLSSSGTVHPVWSACVHYLDSLPPADPLRIKRAKQLFLYLLVSGVSIPEPGYAEEELNRCFSCVRKLISEDKKR